MTSITLPETKTTSQINELLRFLKGEGYDIDHCEGLELSAVFNEEGYCRILTTKESRSLYAYCDEARTEYANLAMEHYLITKYWGKELNKGWLMRYQRYKGQSWESCALERIQVLARVMEGIEVDYMIARRRLFLDNVARRDVKNENNIASAELINLLKNKPEILVQTTLF